MLTPFNAVEAELTRARVGKSYTITLAANVEEPHAPTVNATGVNAFECLMRHRQSAHRRAQITSPSDLTGWMGANTANYNGDLCP